MLIATAHGAKFEAPERPFDILEASDHQPTIAEIAAQLQPPRSGADTLAASRAAMALMSGKERSDGGER